jgi:hypothetical protein
MTYVWSSKSKHFIITDKALHEGSSHGLTGGADEWTSSAAVAAPWRDS